MTGCGAGRPNRAACVFGKRVSRSSSLRYELIAATRDHARPGSSTWGADRDRWGCERPRPFLDAGRRDRRRCRAHRARSAGPACLHITQAMRWQLRGNGRIRAQLLDESTVLFGGLEVLIDQGRRHPGEKQKLFDSEQVWGGLRERGQGTRTHIGCRAPEPDRSSRVRPGRNNKPPTVIISRPSTRNGRPGRLRRECPRYLLRRDGRQCPRPRSWPVLDLSFRWRWNLC